MACPIELSNSFFKKKFSVLSVGGEDWGVNS